MQFFEDKTNKMSLMQKCKIWFALLSLKSQVYIPHLRKASR